MDNDWKVIAFVSTAIIGVYGWLIKHLSNSRKHPCADNLVFKDVCQAQRDCIETSVSSLKELIEQRFDHLEKTINDNN